MREWTVAAGERGQRLNKYLQRRMPEAPSSFLYKMLRKKNIKLNGGKACGSELLNEGDVVTAYLSDETISKFGGIAKAETYEHSSSETPNTARSAAHSSSTERYLQAYRRLRGRIGAEAVLYEDDNVLLVRKPSGILTQKASESDISLNEWLPGYLLDKGDITAESLSHFRPSVCSRLDRNTGGIVICSKTLLGARRMTELLRSRDLHKYYQAVVLGQVSGPGRIEGTLTKNSQTNSVFFHRELKRDGKWSLTLYRPLKAGRKCSLMELELCTGRTHQLRIHLAEIGHPIVGDSKYGMPEADAELRRLVRFRGQLLWCCRMEFPKMTEEFAPLSERVIVCDPPSFYREIVR